MLLVDAYNVLHVTGVLPPDLAGLEVQGLARLILRSRYRQTKAVLVCDGIVADAAQSPSAAPVEIRYAGAGKSADSFIMARILSSSAPRRLTVVTSDREIQRAARRRDSRVVESAEFLGQLVLDLSSWREARESSHRSLGAGTRPREIFTPEHLKEAESLTNGMSPGTPPAALPAAEQKREIIPERTGLAALFPEEVLRDVEAMVAASQSEQRDAAANDTARRADASDETDPPQAPDPPRREGIFPESFAHDLARLAEAHDRERRPPTPQPRQAVERPSTTDPVLPDSLIAEAQAILERLRDRP